MQISTITQHLESTLNPNLIRQAQNSLLGRRHQEGFVTKLLIIGDDGQYNPSIRQSALIYVKNALIDAYKQNLGLPDNDFQTVKSSILQALIRNCQQRSLTPTIRQIIYILAEHQFPDNWHQIVPEIANIIQSSGDFNQLSGSIQALKAIVSAFSKKVDKKLTLENLCNKIMLPLLSLASKLFQNYNETTSIILISIFKIFSSVTNFHIPQIVVLNMHSWMIFVKKLLDLNIESGDIDQNMYQLKKICLRILFRFYQRHLNKKFSDTSLHIINDFHNKFTKGIVESLLLQIINQAHLSKTSNNKNYIHLTKFSLACLSYIYEQDRNAALLVDIYRDKIIYLCLQRFKIKLNKGFSSYEQFATKLNQQRVHFCQFIKALIKNQTRVAEQKSKGNYNCTMEEEVSAILGTLYAHIQKGDMQLKQLCLYIYSQIASVLPGSNSEIQSKMLTFILKIVKPLLVSQDAPTIIKLRCCQILSKYSYIQIPENQLTQIGGGVYGCLTSNSNQPQTESMTTFLQIHSVHAFNSLLRYDYIINFTSPFLNNILQVYTSLLEIEVSIIKCLEDMLTKFQAHLQPYGNHLVEMLTEMYFKYNDLVVKFKTGQIKGLNNKKNQNTDEDSEGQQYYQSADNNYLTASKACLGAIRQIIQAPHFTLEREQLMHNLLVSIFSDKQQLHTQQGFNILNQIIFKSQNLKSEYNIYFSVIIYGILPLDHSYIQAIKTQNSPYSNALLNMLGCLCANPDADFIENTIGCLRNFISKYQQQLRNQIDNSGLSFLELILNAVKYVHQNQSTKATQTERSIILTLYISLIQWKAVNDNQLRQILHQVGNWLSMQKQSCQQGGINDSKSKISCQQSTTVKLQSKKTVYCPIYIQIVLLAVHFYPQVTLSVMNGNWIGTQVLQNWGRFHCDYENSRLLVGIADLLSYQSITDKLVSSQIMNKISQIIQNQCKIRVGQENDDIKSQDDEAQEEKYFGMDQNTHIMGWKSNNPTKNIKNQEQMEQEQSDQEDEEQEQFNKYYQSPLENIDQVNYIFNVLRNASCQAYMNLMRNDQQQKLSLLILNAPPKFSTNN